MTDKKVIDIASYQHPDGEQIDYAAVQADGVEGVWVKGTEGVNYINPYMETDTVGFHRIGVPVGVYHFAHLHGPSPLEQALFFNTHTAANPYSLGRCIDVEPGGGFQRGSAAESEFVRLLLDASHADILYTTRALYEGMLRNGAPWGRRLWIAAPGATGREYDAEMVQTGKGHVAGINGPVDLNVWYDDHPVTPSVPVESAVHVDVNVRMPQVKQGDRNEAVRHVQQLLNRRGGNLDVDGIFGPKTHAQVVAFQRHYRLTPDGIVGPNTWAALLSV